MFLFGFKVSTFFWFLLMQEKHIFVDLMFIFGLNLRFLFKFYVLIFFNWFFFLHVCASIVFLDLFSFCNIQALICGIGRLDR